MHFTGHVQPSQLKHHLQFGPAIGAIGIALGHHVKQHDLSAPLRAKLDVITEVSKSLWIALYQVHAEVVLCNSIAAQTLLGFPSLGRR